MDFSKTNDLKDDLRKVGGEPVTYPIKIRTLPLIKVRNNSYSPDQTTSINKAVISMTGDAALELRIFNGLDNDNFVTKYVRRPGKTDALQSDEFSGQLLVEGIEPNGCPYPEVEIFKDDDGYLEISSVVITRRIRNG